LEVGKHADIVLLDWGELAFPYLDESVSIVDAIVHRAKTQAVDTVIIDGNVVMTKGRFTHLNKHDVLRELSDSLKPPLSTTDERHRGALQYTAESLREFYRKYAKAPNKDWMLN
jgi:cytosine/adenosine deaminase-related metal-dependent hydrolase